MKYYFSLQYKMMLRQLKEMGIQPVLALIIAIIGLFAGTFLLYLKTDYAPWIIVLISTLITSKTSESNKIFVITESAIP